MIGLGTVLMVSSLYDSYGLAGQVTGVYVAVQAFATPQLAKLVDRFGQSRVMVPAVCFSLISITGLVTAAIAHTPPWVMMIAAAAIGLTMGSIGALVRARWTAILTDANQLHTAYALESSLDEVVFIIGPVAATLLATSIHPAAGVITPMIALVIGSVWFFSQKSTEPPLRGKLPHQDKGALLLRPGMAPLCGVFVGLGFIFGAIDVSVIAFATEVGRRDLSGAALAAIGVGSFIGGIAFGMRSWSMPLWKRFTLASLVLAAGVSTFMFVHNLLTLAIVAGFVGLVVGPTFITGTSIAQIIAPKTRLVEALSWISTSLNLGVASGSWLAGIRIDDTNSHGGLEITMLAGILVAVLALATMPTLRNVIVYRPEPANTLEVPDDNARP